MHKYIYLILLSISLSSCFSYKPAAIHSPNFEKGGDVNIGGYVGNNVGGTVSVSPLNHIALIGDVSYGLDVKDTFKLRDNKVNQDNEASLGYHYRDYAYSAALGAYWKYKNNLFHSFYVGATEGRIAARAPVSPFVNWTDIPSHIEAFKGDYRGYFFQSSLMWDFDETEKEKYIFSLDAKFSLLDFNSIEYVKEREERSGWGSSPSLAEKDEAYFSASKQFITQLGLSMHTKMKYLNLFIQFQLCLSHELNGEYPYANYDSYFVSRPFNLYFGLSLPINQFWE